MWNINRNVSIPRFEFFSRSSIIFISVFFISFILQYSTNANRLFNNEVEASPENDAKSYHKSFVDRRNIFKQEAIIRRKRLVDDTVVDIDNRKMTRINAGLDVLHRKVDRTMNMYQLMRLANEYRNLQSENFTEQLSQNDNQKNVSAVDSVRKLNSDTTTTVIPVSSSAEFEEQSTSTIDTSKSASDTTLLDTFPGSKNSSKAIYSYIPEDEHSDKISTLAIPFPFHNTAKLNYSFDGANVTPETETTHIFFTKVVSNNQEELDSANISENAYNSISSRTTHQNEDVTTTDSMQRMLNARRSPDIFIKPNFLYDGEIEPTNQNDSTNFTEIEASRQTTFSTSDQLQPLFSTNVPAVSDDNMETFFKNTRESNSSTTIDDVATIENHKNKTDFVPYHWKQVCFQNVNEIRHSLENDVISLPENKADLYIFYYVPKSSAAIDPPLLYLKNNNVKRYSGGYLKHKYTKSNTTDSKKYTGFSLQQHKLMHSYNLEKNSRQIRTKRMVDQPILKSEFCPPCSSISVSDRSTICPPCPNIPIVKSDLIHPPPHCTYIPFLNNFTYDSFHARARTIANNTIARAKTNENINRRNRRYIYAIDTPFGESNCTGNFRRCDDQINCVQVASWCNGIIDCNDGSDEIRCSCKERVDKDKLCDGFFDCPGGEDENGCFGCPKETFSCDDWTRWKPKSTCVSINRRCDNRNDCINKKDEKDCALLADSVHIHETFFPSYVAGYLHSNWKGRWYPVCVDISQDNHWGKKACESELGAHVRHVETELLPFYNEYNGSFIEYINDEIRFVEHCIEPGYAVYVKCPSISCGSRVIHDDFQSNYRSRRDALLNNTAGTNGTDNSPTDSVKHEILNQNDDITNRTRRYITSPKIVGGDFSYPGRWPWLVAVYKNGNFHCGGAILDETWIVSAAHCVKGYEGHYFEIQAGVLRRLSFSPSEQIRAVTHVIMHPEYTHDDMKNDIALLHLDKPLKYSRWVRPTCLPEARPPWGPVPGSFCTAVGWGSTQEKGPDPDSLKEVEMPILSTCKHQADRDGDEICAGYLTGGQDTCQGDSGGPLMCRIPFGHDRWYIGGVVSHGEGCGRPFEPGAYTRIALFLPWLLENTDKQLLTPVRKSKHECPGIKCKQDGRCIARNRICDSVIDCLDGDDEINCDENYPMFVIDDPKLADDSRHSTSVLLNRTRDNSMNRNRKHEYESFSTLKEKFKTDNALIAIQTPRSSNIVGILHSNTNKETNKESSNTTKKDEYENTGKIINHFECTLLHQEIPIHFYCDGDVDCEDGTDEINCTCADLLKTLNKSRICDGILDCHDLTDETTCPDRNCSNDQFFCYKSRVCISQNFVCNNRKDCPQGEDEQSCYALSPFGNHQIGIEFDIFGKPSFAERGLLAQNKENQWKLFCDHQENDANESTSVRKLATRLGFKGYKKFEGAYIILDKDIQFDKKMNYCHGLKVDLGLAHIDDDVVIPWRANIFINGILKYFAFIIETQWVLTDKAFCKNYNNETDYVVAALGGNEEHSRIIKSYHEQIIKIDRAICSPESETSLLHLNEPINITEHTRVLYLPETGEHQAWSKRCLLAARNFATLSTYELKRETNCSSNNLCYTLSNKTEFCSNWIITAYKNAAIICLSNNFWFLSSLIDHNLTYCDTNVTVLEVNRLHFKYNLIHSDNIEPLTIPECDGYRCNLGMCIPWYKVCDGKPDCREREDELDTSCETKANLCRQDRKYCVCKIHEFKCKNEKCVPKSTICNGKDDCGDNSDEPTNCSNFTCANYLNITDPGKICDSYKDCLDKSDDDINYCPSLCNFTSTFRCSSSNICIPLDFVCDGEKDCDLGEDESDCRKLMSQLPIHNNYTNEGVVWIRSNGQWEKECVTPDFTSLNVEQLCADFGYTHVINVEPLQTSNGQLSTPFVNLKLNENIESIVVRRNVLGKSTSIESCDYIHLTCK